MAEHRVIYLLLVSCAILANLVECVRVSLTAASEERLPIAYASPINVDPELDCAVKELAWEYAKKLLPRVSPEESLH